VEDALAATLGAALVATARPADADLRNELLASALGLLKDAGHGLNPRRTAAVKKLIDVVGDRDSSNQRIRQGAIATFLHVTSDQGAQR
jgi:hypothetical protein